MAKPLLLQYNTGNLGINLILIGSDDSHLHSCQTLALEISNQTSHLGHKSQDIFRSVNDTARQLLHM